MVGTARETGANRARPQVSHFKHSKPRAFTAEDYSARIARAVQHARTAGLDGLVVGPGPDLEYFTGYIPTAITERPTLLVLSAESDPALLLPVLERPDAEEAVGIVNTRLTDFADGQNPYEKAASFLRRNGAYGVSDSCWSLHLLGLQQELADIRFFSLTQKLPMLRATKGEDELARLAAAGASADACFPSICELRFAGRREIDVSRDLADLLLANGHSQVDFAIVASGPNGANPHHLASDRVIQEGDMVVLDYGGLMDGYGSDTSRTVHVGEPTEEERRVYETVRQAQEVAFQTVRPGVTCQEIDRAGRRVIAESGYGEYFIHRIGHGIGMTTHEPPYMVEGEIQPLVPGMCFSIEPGIYLPGRFGVRIEDIVVVTDTGGRRLNHNPHEMVVVS